MTTVTGTVGVELYSGFEITPNPFSVLADLFIFHSSFRWYKTTPYPLPNKPALSAPPAISFLWHNSLQEEANCSPEAVGGLELPAFLTTGDARNDKRELQPSNIWGANAPCPRTQCSLWQEYWFAFIGTQKQVGTRALWTFPLVFQASRVSTLLFPHFSTPCSSPQVGIQHMGNRHSKRV